MITRLHRGWAAAAVLIAGVGLPAISLAQAPDSAAIGTTSASSSATLVRGGPMSELLAVYVPRSESEIRRMLGNVRDMERSAIGEIEEARRLATEAEGRVRITREEIETTKVRRDVAKKAKDDAGRSELDTKLKRQQRELEYLERLRDALRADADRIEDERVAARARVESLELELQVADRHAALVTAVDSPEEIAKYRQVLQRMLDAQKQSAERWGDASESRKRVAERKLKQLQALSKLAR